MCQKKQKVPFIPPMIRIEDMQVEEMLAGSPASGYATGSDGESGDGEGGNGEIPEDAKRTRFTFLD